jgi:hypothetical protein
MIRDATIDAIAVGEGIYGGKGASMRDVAIDAIAIDEGIYGKKGIYER